MTNGSRLRCQARRSVVSSEKRLSVVLIFSKPGGINPQGISFFGDCWLMYANNDNKSLEATAIPRQEQ